MAFRRSVLQCHDREYGRLVFGKRACLHEYSDKIELRTRLDNWDEKTTLIPSNIIKYRLSRLAYEYYKAKSHWNRLLHSKHLTGNNQEIFPITVPWEYLLKLSKCFQRHDEAVTHKATGNWHSQERIVEKPGLQKTCDVFVLNQLRTGLKTEYLRTL